MLSLFLVWCCVTLLAVQGLAAASLKQKAIHSYAILGTHTGFDKSTGQRPARRNILDLQHDAPQWSLYIQALRAMQKKPEANRTSWYQIAGTSELQIEDIILTCSGIHGRPYAPWDNVQQTPDAPTTGYCTHSSVLFVTWHRPYLALFEQVLGHHAQGFAAQYPAKLKATYQTAANNLRMPYWDWASIPEMPDIINTAEVLITTPTGRRNVSNPLLQYRFQNFPLNSTYFPTGDSDGFLATNPYTVRNPPTQGSDTSDIADSNGQLANAHLGSQTYYTLTSNQGNYDGFATDAQSGASVESIHNNIHVMVGGYYGHMTYVSYAGFDPIFWLHHTNVDRLAALYQAINPNSYLTPAEEPGTFTLLQGSTDDVNTPLAPFSTDSNYDFWTSSTSQALSTFGYTYPEINDWNQSASQLQVSVAASINTLYGPNSTSPQKRSFLSFLRRRRTTTNEWTISTRVSKQACGGSPFVIRVFLGTVPAQPSDWAASSALVGSVAVLPAVVARTGPGAQEMIVHDEIPLAAVLKERGIDTSNAAGVNAYLVAELLWKVQFLNGTEVEGNLDSLSVSVQQLGVVLNGTTGLPQYQPPVVLPKVTSGKIGGVTK